MIRAATFCLLGLIGGAFLGFLFALLLGWGVEYGFRIDEAAGDALRLFSLVLIISPFTMIALGVPGAWWAMRRDERGKSAVPAVFLGVAGMAAWIAIATLVG